MPPGPGQISSNAMGKAYRLLTRVKGVGPDFVDIERPLTANVSLAWAPRFHDFQPQVSGVGVEDLTIRFKWDTYKGHLKVRGVCVGACIVCAGTWCICVCVTWCW